MAKRGFKLAVTYLVPDEGTKFEKAMGLGEDDLFLKRVDATKGAAVDEFVAEAAARWGNLNVACALVGAWAGGKDTENTDDVRFDLMIDVNLRSAFHTVRAAVPHLREAEWGRLITIGSRAALEAPTGQVAYNVAKAGVIALARTVANELRDTNVTSNAIVPAVIDTPETREALRWADYMQWPTPEEIAEVVAFVAGESSAVINGAVIPVYGKA
jgi:NAD(P)-dependent dehydrogenase (short-subunit alcohol dehydrogenase family)